MLVLGNLGAEAAKPVMEGKAMLFKELAGVDAFPLCLDTTDVDRIVEIVRGVAPTFGGINLEDIAAPRCFEIERRLREALINAVRLVDKRAADVRVVMVGVGAAGIAVADMLFAHGVTDLIGCDRHGALYPGRPGLDAPRAAFAAKSNPNGLQGTANELLAGADVFIGLSGPGAVSAEAIRTMAPHAVVFAMANPVPEVQPEDILGDVAIVATGRSDYPNQINNVLAFPGVFRGALHARATPAVAAAVADAAVRDGVARQG